MLELRPNCECCDKDLALDSTEVRICTFECTFCADCTDLLQGQCPNCGGELLQRPRRPANKLANNPPATKRVFAAGLREKLLAARG